jgi:murein DD-endopeptidase MepM/ murein hydrolase activator NlpD
MTAAAGTPVVAPLAGTVAFVAYQAGGAGHYVVLTAEDGRTMFFAHLQSGSVGVRAGQRVAAATTLGRVGSTGASSGPHLHFEIWIGGWRHQGGRPIDPLPQLRAWAR